MKLGFNIRLIRKKWKLNQDQLGQFFGGISTAQIGKYENNENDPRLPVLLKLVEMTGISIYDLCTRVVDISEIPSEPLKGYQPKKVEGRSSDGGDEVKELQGDLIKCLKENRELRMENLRLRESIVGDEGVD